MAKASPIQTSFNAGELSPQMKGRPDLDKYGNGCDTLQNFLPRIHGPATKRNGTRFVREVKDSTKNVTLLPFEFNIEQAYVLEFGDLYIRFYMDGGIILLSGSPYEIVSPYAHGDVAEIRYAQSADVMYLSHPNYPPYKLSRTGHTAWTITKVDFDWPPFSDQNTTAVTVTASAISGTGITLTASSALFASGHVGSFFRLEEVIASKYNLWKTAETISSGDFRVYEGSLYKATNGATTGTRPPIHKEGTESDGAVNWEYQHDGAGYAEITAFTSSTVVTATVIKQLPASSTSGTKRWSEGEWSDYRGWPRVVAFYEDRLWFAGSVNKPQTLWASTSGDYENHKYGTNDDDALNYTINSQEVNLIRWLIPGKVMLIGTSGGEFSASASAVEEAITPTNVRIVRQTTYGSSGVIPFRVANSVLFVQRAGKKIRELAYQFEPDAYVAPDLTLLAEHITGGGIVDMSYQQEPYQIVWVVREDGLLVGMTYERAEDVVGWHTHPMSGAVKSVTTIPHWNGDQDSTWVVVERTIDGSTKKYIEYLEEKLEGDYAFHVDSGLTYDGVAATTISGLSHLEGEVVSVLRDGAVHPDRTVSGGSITLQEPGSIVNIGKKMTAILRTMPLEAGAEDGTSQGKTMRVTNLTLRLFETGPGLFYGPDVNTLDELQIRTDFDLMDNPVPLFTGDTETLPWPGGYEKGSIMTIQHESPLPCTVIALMPQVVTNDR